MPEKQGEEQQLYKDDAITVESQKQHHSNDFSHWETVILLLFDFQLQSFLLVIPDSG
jgi:hypothetical protein